MDFIIGILIFIFSIILYYSLSSNLYNDENAKLSDILFDINAVSSSLVSGGFPPDWSNDSVVRIGLTNDDYRINQTKLASFYNMSYPRSKSIFSTSFEYAVFFENKSSNILNLTRCGFGSPNAVFVVNNGTCESVDLTNANPKSLLKAERFLIYNSTIIKMVIYLWA